MDVEEHFQVHGFESVVRRGDWGKHESRIGRNVERTLELCRRHRVKGTFFVLAWSAERGGSWFEDILAEGHELASHGYSHEILYKQGREAFAADLKRSREVLESRAGARMLGYRAPSYSITRSSMWAFEVLKDQGFEYDSSVFPIARRKYGIPDAPCRPYDVAIADGRSIREFPLSALDLGVWRLPVAAGAYLRLLPAFVHHAALRQYEHRGFPAVINVHPWELDPGQPRIAAPAAARFFHYTGLGRTEGVLDSLLSTYRFGPLRDQVPAAA